MAKHAGRQLKSGKSLFALALAAWVAATAPTIAQDPSGSELEVIFGFGGLYVPGAPVPIGVDVSKLRLGVSHVEISIPDRALVGSPPSYARYRLNVQEGPSLQWLSAPMDAGDHPLLLRAFDAEGRAIASKAIELPGKAAAGNILLALDPAEESWAWASQTQERGDRGAPGRRLDVGFAPTARHVPDDPIALRNVAAIAVRDAFPLGELSSSQQDAIAAYVQLGGHLIVTGGSTPPNFPLSWRSWLPPMASGRVVPLQFAGKAAPSWELRPEIAESAISVDGAVIGVTAPVGAGRVTVFAVGPTSPLLSGSEAAASRYLETALLHAREPSALRPFPQRTFWEILAEYPSPQKPPSNLAWMVGLYAAGCTALTAWGMQRRRGWWIIGSFAVACGALLWAYTGLLGIRDRVDYREAQVTETSPTGLGVATAYASLRLIDPAETVAQINGPGDRFVIPAWVDQSPPMDATVLLRLGGAQLELTSSRRTASFHFQTVWQADISATWDAAESSVRVVNRGAAPLRHALLVDRERFAYLGNVPANAALTTPYPAPGAVNASPVSAGLQSHVLRLPRRERPDPVDMRLLAAAVEQAIASRRDPAAPSVFIVALTDPLPLIGPAQSGSVERRHVLIAPVAAPPDPGGET